jgi:tetratricopeptide (TPR) repeat protein
MNSQAVDWIPALAVLAAGVLGAGLLWRVFAGSRRMARAGAGIPLQVRDLAGKRDALLRQLRELEDTASKRTPEQLARERYALELETAQVLLALDERRAPAQATPSPAGGAETPGRARPAPSVRSGLRGFLWGTATAAALLILGFFVYQSAKPREPGGSVTGDVPAGGRPSNGDGSPDREEAQIQAALARNPADIEARLALVRLYVGRRDWMNVWNETTQVLQRDPENPRALAYQAFLRLAMGQAEVAAKLLTRALAKDPDLVDAYAYLALAYVRLGRVTEAELAIATASKRFPDRAAELQRLFAAMQKQEAALPQAAVGGNAKPVSRASATRRIAGTVDIDPSIRSTITPGSILFVFARKAGAVGGPPVAAKRLPATFPVAFELSEADSMMGQSFPDALLIEARLDSDGDPATRAPTDPQARLDRVKAGQTDLRLVLRRR